MKKGLSMLLALMLLVMATPVMAMAAEETARPILIQGAMDLETSTMMAALEGAQDVMVSGYHYVTGTIDGYPVVVSKTQVGMVNAATTTTIALIKWNPCVVINQGTAGGHDVALHKGDIVLGTTTVNVNSFKSEWADAGAGIDPTKWENRATEVLQNGEVVEVMELKSDAKLVEFAKNLSAEYEKGQVVEGVIGSGDVWNKELDRINLIHSQFGTSCEEMETFSVAQVCAYFDVPFLGMRILSNNELHKEDFDPQTGEDCQLFTLEVVRALIADQQALDQAA
ncbi:MAG: 5'-methylthioadenosine/S-adenosylhomocysteine nucleosidase [Clostridia bacterium]